MPEAQAFAYVAVDRAGRRSKGRLEAESLPLAHAELKARGLSPVSLKLGSASSSKPSPFNRLSDRDAAECASDLAALLGAGADMRTALDMLAERSDVPAVRRLAKALLDEISGGTGVGAAFRAHLDQRHRFVSSLVSAGESGTGLVAGLLRAAEMLQARVTLREQLITSLSYPAFVLITTVGAMGAILFFVIPALAPLVQDAGGQAPVFLGVAIALSSFLRQHVVELVVALATLIAGSVLWWRTSAGQALGQRALLDGPARPMVSRLVFGGFAVTLGNLLSGGSSMSDALRLSIESVGSPLARARLDAAALRVRQGDRLSAALDSVRAFPTAIIRLAAVGEASGALGLMLSRGGRLEEEKAVRQLEAMARLLGPVLIVLLGGVIGLLMAGLLSGVSQLGSAAIQ